MTIVTHPALPPVDATVVIANVLPSGAAFGIRLDDGSSCYVPVSVASASNATIGAEFTAKLVPNRYPDKVDRTPWLAIHMTRSTTLTAPAAAAPVQYAMPFDQFDPQVAPTPAPSVADRVRHLMKKGGVWTVATLFEELFPSKTRGDGLQDYNAISAAVRAMYAKGECSKFQLWRAADQTKPSREWFTCYPEKADVDEWEE